MKKKNLLAKKTKVQQNIVVQNALDEALRIADGDLWQYNTSLDMANALNNVKIDVLSLQQMVLTNLYKAYGILSKVVEVPVDDAYRYGGFDIEAETISDDEVFELDHCIQRNCDVEILKQARKWARLFGGAAIVCLDGGKLNQPLKLQKDREYKFIAVDRWQLTYSKPNIDMAGGKWQLTNYDTVQVAGAEEIHESRIHIIHGKTAPFIVEQQVQGWGISVYEQIFQDMSQFFKSRNVLFELLDEAKTDILKLEALETALGSQQGERALQKMVDLVARNKNYKSQITLSTNDDYDQKQISFSGMADILREIRVMMAGSANMPVNKLWGEGVTGFGSGEDSLENYNGLIESEIRSKDLDVVLWMLKIRCHQLFGREVEDLFISWKELRVLSSTDEQSIENQRFDNILKLFDRQLITPQETMEILKKQKLLLHDTKAIRGELEDLPLYNMREDEDERTEDQRLQK